MAEQFHKFDPTFGVRGNRREELGFVDAGGTWHPLSTGGSAGGVIVTGNLAQGETLTAAMAPGWGNTGWQWYRDSAPISGATSATYTLQAADVAVGVTISVRASGVSITAVAGTTAGVPPGVVAPTFNAQPQVGVQVSYTAGAVTGAPTPSSAFELTVAGVVKSLPYTPISADEGQTIILTQTATSTQGSATASVSSVIAAAPPVAPTITAQPSNASVTEGGTATFTVAATGTAPLAYQWQRNPTGSTSWANIAGATAASYTTPASTVSGGSANNTDTYRCVVTNTGGSATSNVATLTVTASLTLQNRPRMVVAPANVSADAAFLAAMTAIGSVGSKNATFSLTTTAGNYGWVAVPAALVGAGVTFTDVATTFTGGWAGATSAGNNSSNPEGTKQIVNDAGGQTFWLFRQDYVNANPSATNWQIS